MNQERIYVIALLAIGLLASIPQIPVGANIWGMILVVVGIVGGVMVNYSDMMQRLMVYVVAVAMPIFSDALNVLPTVGPWLNTLLDNVATGIQGMAIGLVVMGLLARAKG
ncbi:MAG: hypothetical protein QNI96_11740 [Woeseiaceae bacterium]|nr:hypothetical protein [Woeseiaceae bacterium]